MKTPEDEAFDDLARKQGDWGGGFPAKRQMAADKQNAELMEWCQIAMEKINSDFDKEYIKYREAYREAFFKGHIAPQQEPADKLYHSTEARWCENFVEVKHPHIENEIVRFYFTHPVQRPWVGLTDEETSGFTQHEMTVVKYVSKVLQEKNG